MYGCKSAPASISGSFNPTITDRTTSDAPKTRSEGVEWLVFNGALVIEGGEMDLNCCPDGKEFIQVLTVRIFVKGEM